jgi:serine/threonine-protein kinase RsbW
VRLEFRVPAEPAGVGSIRRQVRGWLSGLEWPLDELDDLLLATNEACTNAVEHAYLPGAAGDVMVTLCVAQGGTGSRQVIVVVRDWGHWRPVPVDPGFRGHGLTVMRGLTERTRIRRDHHGTSVTMTSCPVPVLPPVDEGPSARSIR